MSWISTNDELPSEAEHVLVFDEHEGICRGYLYNDHWSHYPMGSFASDACLFNVMFWMPLPELPDTVGLA